MWSTRVYSYNLQPFQVEGHLNNMYQLESGSKDYAVWSASVFSLGPSKTMQGSY